MKTVNQVSGIVMNYGKVEAKMILANELKKGVMQAQISQMVSKTYPSAKLNTSLFSKEEFTEIGEGKQYDASDRRALIDVPKGVTIEQVQAKLDKLENACLYQFISTNVFDVLTEGQVQAINTGLQTQGFFEAKLLVRNKLGEQITDNNGDLLTYYRQVFFSPTPVDDKDFRNAKSEEAEFYLNGEQPAQLTKLDNLVKGTGTFS